MHRLLAVPIVLFLLVGGLVTAPEEVDAVVPGDVGRIVFWSNRDHPEGELYTRAFSGGPWVRLTSNTAHDLTPAWSPDGNKIAYASNVAGNYDVWVMADTGEKQLNLTNDASDNIQPAWSPDGSLIAYIRGDYNSSEDMWLSDVWIMGADGSDKINVTPETGLSLEQDPDWSPDGSKIAFTSDRGGSNDIYTMNPKGGDVTNLTKSASSNDSEPAWSPDGKQIAFLSNRGGTLNHLYVMAADGSNVRPLTPDSVVASTPSWSPDGRSILFTAGDGGRADLAVVHPDGSNFRLVTDDPGLEYWGAWESVNRPPVAVDDGPVTVWRGGAVHASSVLANDRDPDGEALTPLLVTPPSHAAVFTLQPDGRFIYHHDDSPPATDSFQYRVEDDRSGMSNIATVTIRVLSMESAFVGLVDPGSGVWRLRDSSLAVTEFYYGDPGDYPFMGDWDCDGVDTPGLYRQSDGFVYLRNSNTQGIADRTFYFGDPGDVPIAGDFNGDYCDTVSIYRPSEARFYIINELGQDGGGLGAADYSFLFGDAGDKPVVGDWDGDGVEEIGLHRESTGYFYYRNTLSTGIADGQFYFGDPDDRLVAGDWGVVDGVDTPGLFRPSDKRFYFRYSLTQGNADSQFTWTGAGSSWLPVAGFFS